MTSIVRHLIRCVATCLVLLPATRTADAQQIACEGQGATRDAAVETAKRKLVERGLEVLVGSGLLSPHGIQLRDETIIRIAKLEGAFAVSTTQDDAVWTAEISTSEGFLHAFQSEMLDVAALLKLEQYPRVMVVPDEVIDDEPTNTWATTTAIESFLLEKGLEVVDATQVRENRRRDLLRAAEDPALAAEIGRQYGAELILTGKARIAQAGVSEPYEGLGKQHFHTANLNLKLVETASARVIGSTSASAHGGASSSEAGAQLAMRRAAEAIAPRLFLQAICKWNRQHDEGSTEYEVAVIRTDYATLENIRETIQSDEQVSSVTDATLVGGIGRFRVRMRGSLSDLQAIVHERVTEPLSIESPTTARLELSLKTPKVEPAEPPHDGRSPSPPEQNPTDNVLRNLAASAVVIGVVGAVVVLILIARQRGH